MGWHLYWELQLIIQLVGVLTFRCLPVVMVVEGICDDLNPGAEIDSSIHIQSMGLVSNLFYVINGASTMLFLHVLVIHNCH